MENIEQKANFLKNEYANMLQQLDEHAPRKWGKMNVRQMIEHMSDYIRIASGRIPMSVITPEENLGRMQGFLESERHFKENTPNVLLPDEPAHVKHATKQDAINELQDEVTYFFEVYGKEPEKAVANPFFGVLDFDHQVQLLYKHSTHHLRQFGIDIS